MLLGDRQALSMTAGDHRDTGLYRLVSADTQFWPGGGGREKIETANSQQPVAKGGAVQEQWQDAPQAAGVSRHCPKARPSGRFNANHDGAVKRLARLGLSARKRRERRAPTDLRHAAVPGNSGAASGCARRQSGGKNSAGQVVSGIARDQENPSAFPGRQAAALYGRQGCLPPLRHPPQPAANAARNSTRNFGTTSNGSYGARPACRVSMGR